MLALFERDRRRYGGYLVHLGLGVMAIAAVASSVYQEQTRALVAPGESFEIGRYTVDYIGLSERAGVANGIDSEVVAVLRVEDAGRFVAVLEPGRRFFDNFPGQPLTKVDIESGLREDLYLFLQGWDEEGVAEISAFVNPLMIWLWIGAGVYVAGGLVVFAPVNAPARQRRDLPSAAPAEPIAEA